MQTKKSENPHKNGKKYSMNNGEKTQFKLMDGLKVIAEKLPQKGYFFKWPF